MADVKKGRLGGASAALLGRRGAEALASLATAAEAGVTELTNAVEIDITKIAPDPQQPRKSLDPEALQELADSIAEKGILQPIVVRREDDHFIIVAGERRYRAGVMAGLERIPAMIREVASDEAVEQSLIENLQRENIEPIEESSSFRQLMQVHGYSMRDLAARLHKSHAYVAERLQLTRHADIAEAVASGSISAKAASELARVEEPELRQSLLERVQRREIDSRHIRQAKRGDAIPARGRPNITEANETGTTSDAATTVLPVPVTGATTTPPLGLTGSDRERSTDQGTTGGGPRTDPERQTSADPLDINPGISPDGSGEVPTRQNTSTDTQPTTVHRDSGSRTGEAEPSQNTTTDQSIAYPPLEAVALATRAIQTVDITLMGHDRVILKENLEALARQIRLLLDRLT